ncbi:MAG: IclR family transcriptional regulator [Betaproteobacteria bacterium]|nr:IclR family transcriptional regulator [Betaproteobacteria bacterium]MCL2887155.1 IclR family transcriptional regulator [Betaproteobacteria bacterium]
MVKKAADARQGIQSIEIGFRLLDVLAAATRPMMLRDIAKGAGMPAAKAHRYMVSFLRIGIVEQDPASSRYDLGAHALLLGQACLRRLDAVQLAGPVLEALSEEIQETVALVVWGSAGPTIVRIVSSGSPVIVTIRYGSVMSLTKSASGRSFLAFFHSPFLKKLLDEDLRETAARSKTSVTTLRRQLEKTLALIREHGISRSTGSLIPGINGLSAPVYDHTGGMVASITAIGAIGEFDAAWDGAAAKALLASATLLSRRLGHNGTMGMPSGAPERNRTAT